jgi:hypothetical protein
MKIKIIFFLNLAPATTTSTQSTSTTTSTTTKKPNLRKRRQALRKPFEWNVQYLLDNGIINPESIASENMSYHLTTTKMPMNEKIKKLNSLENVPYFGICTNNTKVFADPKKIYGYYQRFVFVENPILNVQVGNNPWLKHGDLCRISFKFDGTAPFKYCIKAVKSDNSTAIEDIKQEIECSDEEWIKTDDKSVDYSRFFTKESNSYTVFFHLKNEVSQIITPIGVKFYEGK